jgi:surface antigen
MNWRIMSFMIITAMLSSIGCESMTTKQKIGTGVGAVAGAALVTQLGGGSGKTSAILLGGTLGGVVGYSLASMMENSDVTQMTEGWDTELDKSVHSQWVNENTQIAYESTASSAWTVEGNWCRNYQTSAIIDGKKETIEGIACLGDDGIWRKPK